MSQLLVRYRPSVTISTAEKADSGQVRALVPGLRLLAVPDKEDSASFLRRLRNQPDVLYAEPNHVRRIAAWPNDPRVTEQWNLAGSSATAMFAGIHALDAWPMTTGSSDVVIGLVDTGVDYTHPDLNANIYRNTIDCGLDGLDTDGDGFVDDCYGANAITHVGSATDDHGHGTAMAGIIGAAGNNALGIAGVNWNVKMLPCKALAANGTGTDADIIACFEYLAATKDRGANVVAICAAFGGPAYSQALEEAIAELRARGILLITAAGNDGSDNALLPVYPANYKLANVVSVAATTSGGTLAPYSNFGATTVHIAAPGDQILTTGPNGTYVLTSGTSAAAAHVAGMAALLSAAHPRFDWKQLRNRLLAGGDASAETAGTITGSHANVLGAITCSGASLFATVQPARARFVTTVDNGVLFSALHINCDVPAGAPKVVISPGNIEITLHDDGVAPDDAPADGVYRAHWTPPATGEYTFAFANSYTGTIYVSPYEWSADASDYHPLDAATAHSIAQTTTIALPFPLSFGGSSYSSLTFDSRGLISFATNTTSNTHQPLPTTQFQTLIAPWWSELVPRTASSMRWAVLGIAPQRQLVLDWSDMARSDCTAAQGVSFQAVLFENTADVAFNYARTSFGGNCAQHDYGATATAGIQLDSDIAVTYSQDEPLLGDGLTLRWRANLPDNPAPAISMLQPDSWAIDTSPVAIVIRGSGFAPGSLVLWNGVPRPTSYISATEIYTMATAADLTSTATHQLAVFNALPGGGMSAPATFTVRAPDFILRTSAGSISASSTNASSIGLTVEPSPVFRSEISFSCSGLPAGMQCKFSPATITPGIAPAVVTLSIGAATQTSTHAGNRTHAALWTELALSIFAIAGVFGRKQRKQVLALFAMFALMTVTACGGGVGSNSAPSSPPPSATATTAVVITATGGGISHTQTVSLTYTK